jgi:DNA modification methylase
MLRCREIKSVIGVETNDKSGKSFFLKIDPYTATKARKLVFTHGVGMTALDTEPTWQAIIENGFSLKPSSRKDPKYVTHGLHQYKGKFYPQLAKSLVNLCAPTSGAKVFDPFCGSGTTLLEGYLNGLKSFGCDMNPLAAKIAKAKIGILDVNPDVVREAVGTLVSKIEEAPARPHAQIDRLNDKCIDEISKWFPEPVISKINWLLGSIRSVSEGIIRDFLEVVLSSIIREVSQQDPNDLRIRRRKEPIDDADVFQMYLNALDTQYERIERFWKVRGYSPEKFRPCRVVEGDSRKRATLDMLGLKQNSVDLVLTSPPYATALPYIDTDRLSLLILFGMNSTARRPVENDLIGSREIMTKERQQLEELIGTGANGISDRLRDYLQDLKERVKRANVGFRRKNMPALLLRFFRDMVSVIENCRYVLRPGGEAMIVIGDNRIRVEDDYERIATTDFIQDITIGCGLELLERIDISVTTENLVHIKNAITQNVVLWLRNPKKS